AFLMQPTTATPSRTPEHTGASPETAVAPATSAMESLSVPGRTSLRHYSDAKLPLPMLAKAARGLGYIDLFSDRDGTLRQLPLLVQAHDTTFPHLATAVARDVLGVHEVVLTHDTLRLGQVKVPLTGQGDMVINWYGTLEQQTYQQYSAGLV